MLKAFQIKYLFKCSKTIWSWLFSAVLCSCRRGYKCWKNAKKWGWPHLGCFAYPLINTKIQKYCKFAWKLLFRNAFKMFLGYFSCPDSSDGDSKVSLSETSAVICNIIFWLKITPPLPFPKIRSLWYRHPSLREWSFIRNAWSIWTSPVWGKGVGLNVHWATQYM